MERPNWEEYFMSLACVAAIRSPDPVTKHGSIIVDKQKRILGLGYNGFPRGGIDDSIYPLTRPEKYTFMAHSEVGAILNCSVRPEGATLYVTGEPCPTCMIYIIQAGILKVVYGKIKSHCVDSEWWKSTLLLAKNHRISLQEYKGHRSPFDILQDAKEYLISKEWK